MIEQSEEDEVSTSNSVMVVGISDQTVGAPAPVEYMIAEQPGALAPTTPIVPSPLEPYVPFNQVIPCCGLGCCAISFFPVFPEGFSCGSKCWTFCLLNETIICKQGKPHWIMLGSICNLTLCFAHLKNQSQFFCFDFRLSIPWDKRELPWIFSACFFTFYYVDSWTAGCCKNGVTLEASHNNP